MMRSCGHPALRADRCWVTRAAFGRGYSARTRTEETCMATGKPYHELGAGYFTTCLDPERETRCLIAKLEASAGRSPFSQPPNPARNEPGFPHAPPGAAACQLRAIHVSGG